MIIGIGTDLTERNRIMKACEKERFLSRYYTSKEIVLLQYRPESAAGNFAVKEAAAKALGTGFRGFGPADIEVLRDELGKPEVYLYGGAARRAEELGAEKIHASISDDGDYALAFVVLEGR